MNRIGMNRTGSARRGIALAGAAALLGTSALPAQATAPSDISDLVGVRASSGEGLLRARGYERTGGTSGTARQWSYWWNAASKQCVSVTTFDGRYEAIDKTQARDCGKSGGSGNTAAAAAVGAVALIGAIALATGGKKRDRDRDRYEDYPTGSSGTTPYELRDLIGMRAANGERQLRNRGYKLQDASYGGNSRWAYWWNKREAQCIGVTTIDGRYQSIVSTPASSCGKGGGYSDGGYGNRGYSPAAGVTCYPEQRACYEQGRGYSSYWSSREFRY